MLCEGCATHNSEATVWKVAVLKVLTDRSLTCLAYWYVTSWLARNNYQSFL